MNNKGVTTQHLYYHTIPDSIKLHGTLCGKMATTALLLMDFQQVIVSHLGNQESFLQLASTTAAAARAAGIPVIHVRVAFRPGYPDISPRNQMMARAKTMGPNVCVEGDPSAEFHPISGPLPGDLVVTKRRVSAFSGSDLEVVLRSFGVQNLVLAGVATSGVVLSTLRQAADMDYSITVLEDLCMDSDPEVHQVLVGKVFPKQGTVTKAEEWTATLKAK